LTLIGDNAFAGEGVDKVGATVCIAPRVTGAARKDSDQEILLRSKYITDGLEQLNEKLKFNEVKLINSLDAIVHHKDDTEKEVKISSSELITLFKNYLQINEFKRIQYKC
jgi:hypothetical protein